ncbi:hypothetical protein PR048_011309 [Dryococelus australis]|uniref:Uncharacterized protein n=1 Tax=Dryococelus australis TaxID=614101 RepID=A0ABQ9HMI8_9NEOP|nr:hypothetical protein PR048_011309 [Dryococelus australis]
MFEHNKLMSEVGSDGDLTGEEWTEILCRNEEDSCSLNEVLQFSGDKGKLNELTDKEKYERLLKFLKAEITGEAKSKLLARTMVDKWQVVKYVLEENYAVRRTPNFYSCKTISDKEKMSRRRVGELD